MFTTVQKILLAQAFKEAAESLKIVGQIKDPTVVTDTGKENSPRNKKLCQKGLVKYPYSTPNLPQKSYQRQNGSQHKRNDWKTTTNTYETLLKDAAKEMRTTGTFDKIRTFTYNQIKTIESETSLLEHEENLINLSSMLQIDLENREQYFRMQSLHLNSVLDEVTAEFEDSKIEEAIRLRTVKRWEQTRQSQTAIKLKTIENDFIQKEQDYISKLNEELTNSYNVVQHLDDAIEELFKQIEEWEERIDKELEEVENEFQKEQERKSVFEKKKMEYEEVYEKMSRAIQEHKEHIEREKELIVMAKASIKIQAWWRGTMVRKGFGPFKRKPKKKGKGKKGNRKKK